MILSILLQVAVVCGAGPVTIDFQERELNWDNCARVCPEPKRRNDDTYFRPPCKQPPGRCRTLVNWSETWTDFPECGGTFLSRTNEVEVKTGPR